MIRPWTLYGSDRWYWTRDTSLAQSYTWFSNVMRPPKFAMERKYLYHLALHWILLPHLFPKLSLPIILSPISLPHDLFKICLQANACTASLHRKRLWKIKKDSRVQFYAAWLSFMLFSSGDSPGSNRKVRDAKSSLSEFVLCKFLDSFW